ncbi:acetyl-CoA carboxylase biotin carboxyl carrier protein subunit [Lunatimonas salinarum]|uniref:acetyl-CoA carboxylase biotin carboxyl carrier protein subunit n=1 Tax=Lunatimonas salinarum TaxID=1774590 RepID=UPI001AE0C24D|nr:acetyl-CoA carboxylase biotin carboxyl carrier protein subunit [Lunatimonas salinarum]
MYKINLGATSINVAKSQELFIAGSQLVDWDMRRIKEKHYHILHRNRSHNLEIIDWNKKEKVLTLKLDGKIATLQIQDTQDLLLEKLGIHNKQTTLPANVKAPMPGLILSIPVSVGQSVKKGDTLLILEAMKMENTLKAPQDGTVKAIAVQTGQSVEKNQLLIQF